MPLVTGALLEGLDDELALVWRVTLDLGGWVLFGLRGRSRAQFCVGVRNGIGGLDFGLWRLL